MRDLRRIVDLASVEAAKPSIAGAKSQAAAAGAAARAAAGAAAWAAAWDAAWDALAPAVEALQTSALELLDRMIDPSANRS